MAETKNVGLSGNYEWIVSTQFEEEFDKYLKDKHIEHTKNVNCSVRRGTKTIKVVQYFCKMSFARAIATDDFLGELYAKLYEKHPEADLICE